MQKKNREEVHSTMTCPQILAILFTRSTVHVVALLHPDSRTDLEPWNVAKRGHTHAAHIHADGGGRSVADLLPFLET